MHVCIFQEPVEYASQSTYITLFQKHCDCFTETKTTVFDLLMRVMRLLSRRKICLEAQVVIIWAFSKSRLRRSTGDSALLDSAAVNKVLLQQGRRESKTPTKS